MLCATLYYYFKGKRSKGLDASQVGPWIFPGVKGVREGSMKVPARKISKRPLNTVG